jgi:hypothetical protein
VIRVNRFLRIHIVIQAHRIRTAVIHHYNHVKS